MELTQNLLQYPLLIYVFFVDFRPTEVYVTEELALSGLVYRDHNNFSTIKQLLVLFFSFDSLKIRQIYNIANLIL